MKTKIKYIFFILFATNLFLFSCKKEESKVQEKPKKIPLVQVQFAEKSKMVNFIDLTGTIQANIFSDIKSPDDGIIESLSARENQFVEKDKIIAIINPTDRIALIANNQLIVQQLEGQLKNTTKSTPLYDSLTHQLKNAKNDLEYSKKMFQTIPVICPMSGLVTNRWLDKGSQVNAKDKILTISDMNSLVIKAETNEKYFEIIKEGVKLPVLLNSYPKDTLTGIISLVYPQIDPSTRSIKFDIKILNFSKRLYPGMMASIKIPVAIKENAISVQEHSILTSPDNVSFLFFIDKDSIAHRQKIETGIVSGNKVEIVKGLTGNEQIVVSGQEMLKDGMSVKIIGTPKKEQK